MTWRLRSRSSLQHRKTRPRNPVTGRPGSRPSAEPELNRPWRPSAPTSSNARCREEADQNPPGLFRRIRWSDIDHLTPGVKYAYCVTAPTMASANRKAPGEYSSHGPVTPLLAEVP